VTHKPELLQLVDRIIVVAGHQIVLDGPKADVLAKLQQPRPAPAATAS
jgi:ATP-binding cassette subfamily C protein LapB